MNDRPIIGQGSTLDTRDAPPTVWPSTLPKPQTTPHKPILLALCAPAMGSGKTTIAQHLEQKHNFTILRFAGPLKAMARTLLMEIGEDSETIDQRLAGDMKEQVIPALQVTARQLCQRLGHEFGRLQLHENVWIDVTRQRAAQLIAAGKSVVIDDMRYRNELEAVRWAGGIPLRVTRPGAEVTSQHSSEGELNSEPMTTFANDGSLHDLWDLVDHTLAYLLDEQF